MPEATDLLYNGLQLAVDAVAVIVTVRSEGVRRAMASLGGAVFSSLVLVLLLATDLFHFIRLLGFAIFVHAPILFCAVGWTWRRRSRRLSLGCGVCAGVLVVVAVYAFLVEPFRLEVRHVEIETASIDEPLRIVVVADLQAERIGDYERRTLERVMELAPDVVLMPGDYLQIADTREYYLQAERLRDLLERTGFDAPLGVFAVEGNVEHQDWPDLFEGTRVRPLPVTTSLRAGPLQLTGLGLRDSFDPALRLARAEDLHVVFGHAPDYALGQIDADLLIAGHTHGGQVRLPFWGPIITFSRVPRAWAAGVTSLSDERTLVVSRGIGMERGRAPRMRFLCRPEIVAIDLRPSPAG